MPALVPLTGPCPPSDYACDECREEQQEGIHVPGQSAQGCENRYCVDDNEAYYQAMVDPAAVTLELEQISTTGGSDPGRVYLTVTRVCNA